MTEAAPQRSTSEAEPQQQQQRPVSMIQVPSQASVASSVPEVSMQDSDASEAPDAALPSTSDPDSAQIAARIRSSEPTQVSPRLHGGAPGHAMP